VASVAERIITPAMARSLRAVRLAGSVKGRVERRRQAIHAIGQKKSGRLGNAHKFSTRKVNDRMSRRYPIMRKSRGR
jgi:hypothetical protein